MLILSRVRELDRFFDIFYCNKTFKRIRLIDEWKLLDLVFLKQYFSFLKRCAYRCCNEVIASHDFIDFNGIIMYKAQITIGQNADKLLILVNYRHA